MENASKALIMAASVLIAVMIIGALLLMFNNLSNYQETNVQNDRDAQVVEFNNQYETYNRTDVRGSDLYSLMNRVIDYNRRKSEKATGNDEGKDLKFQAMTITFDFINEENRKNLTFDGTNRVFDVNKYELTEKTTKDVEKNITDKVKNIETAYGTTAITNLTLGIGNLFDKVSVRDKESAIILWNRNRKSGTSIMNISTETSIINNYITMQNLCRNDVYTYYEYIQFKRAHFDCVKPHYNEKTGRITKLEFEFNGTIE